MTKLGPGSTIGRTTAAPWMMIGECDDPIGSGDAIWPPGFGPGLASISVAKKSKVTKKAKAVAKAKAAAKAKKKGKTSTTASAALDADTYNLVSMIPEKASLAFKLVGGTRYGVFAGDVMVAFMDDEEKASEHVVTAAFQEGFDKVAEKEGVHAALQSAGFELVAIEGRDALKHEVATAKAEISGDVDRLVDEKMQRIRRCIDIVASGGVVGMFRKDGMDVLPEALVAELTSREVENAHAIVQEVVPSVIPKYADNLLATALKLTEDPDTALKALSKQIDDMTPSDNVVSLEQRLAAPGRRVAATAMASTGPDSGDNQAKTISVAGKQLRVRGMFRG